MPLQATSGAASYDAFGGGVAAIPNYIEDVFSTYLYTGNGSTQTITNGIDLAGKGGLVWLKMRSAVNGHGLYDTARGAGKILITNSTNAEYSPYSGVSSFDSAGFSLGTDFGNQASQTYASWTFRKQPKFYTQSTYTGTGVARTIAHDLGAVPGCIIVKRTDAGGDNWLVYHRSLGATKGMKLNLTDAQDTVSVYWNNTEPTATEFTVGSGGDVNASGGTYVYYAFAHDAGGFGLTGTDNVISCGSYTGNGTSLQSINLGYEPQLVLIKSASIAGTEWAMLDNMRGVATGGVDAVLNPNTSGAEASPFDRVDFTATGFNLKTSSSIYNETGTYIYIAIRRGPMKVPTSGTSVFSPTAYTATNVNNRLVNTGIVTDMTMARNRIGLRGFYTADRLRGDGFLQTAATDAEATDADSFMTPTSGVGNSFSAMNGFGVGADITRRLNYSTLEEIAYAFRRAPGFFDEVCYTGTGSATTVAHNLGVAPEMMIVKKRSTTGEWAVYYGDNTSVLRLRLTLAKLTSITYWNNTSPTSSVFTVGSDSDVNASGATYVAYLFATCAGVSKVGSYTGTGTTLQVDCGFTAGSRFVLIKRTDDVGDWYVWDSARGIVSGNDPYLLLNSTAAEVTSTDYIDTYSAGFEISSTAPAAINASGGTFIFLAIA